MLEKIAEQSANVARPLTREQARQNAAFRRHLRRTGTVRESARQAGIGYGAIQHRRKEHPGFALRWDAAGAMPQALARERRTSGKGVRDYSLQ